MSKDIGIKLRQLRKSKKLTQEDVAAKIDYKISRSTLSNYEIGRRTPHLKDLQVLSTFYGVSLEYFDTKAKDETFELLARAKEVFESPLISEYEKEQLYHEFMKLYLSLKGND